MCPEEDSGTWKLLSGGGQEIQMIRVPCEGGSAGYVVIDEAFMKQSGVREGLMQGYGDVSRAP